MFDMDFMDFVVALLIMFAIYSGQSNQK